MKKGNVPEIQPELRGLKTAAIDFRPIFPPRGWVVLLLAVVLLHLGLAGQAIAAPGDQKWVFPTGGAVVSCPAIGDDGTIYFGSADTNVYAVDGATGLSKWTFPTGGAINSSAAIGADGTVYIGSSDHKFYALDGGTGIKKWEFVTRGALASPSIGLNGTVYVASADNNIYALDGATGSRVWTFSIAMSAGYPPDSLAIGVDHTVYFVNLVNGATMAQHTMVALNGATGALLWQQVRNDFSFSRPILPAIDEFGRVCMVMESAPAVEFFDGRTGEAVWTWGFGWDEVRGLPIMGREEMVYICTQRGRFGHWFGGLTAFNTRTDQAAWVLDGVYLPAPVLGADGTLYGSIGATLLALDSAIGRTNWQFQAASAFQNSPTIGRDGTVYCGAVNGVYAVEGTSVGGLADTAWPKLNRDARNTGCLPLSNNHAPVLTVPETQVMDELTTLTVTNVATDPDLPANTQSFELVSPPLGAAIDPLTGVFTWTPTEAQGPSTNTITVKVTDNGVPRLSTTHTFVVVVNEVHNGLVMEDIANAPIHITTALTICAHATDLDWPPHTLVYSLEAGAPTGMSIDSQTGVLRWNPDATQRPGTNRVFVQAADGLGGSDRRSFTVVVDPPGSAPASGEEVWSVPVGNGSASGVAIGDDGTVYFGDGGVQARDGATGAEKWKNFAISGAFSCPPTIGADGTLFVRFSTLICGFDGASGGQKQNLGWGGGGAELSGGSLAIGPGGTVYYGIQLFQGIYSLEAIDPDTHYTKWETPINSLSVSLAVAADGTVYAGAGALGAFDGATGQMNWSFPATNCSLALGRGDMLYAASDQVYALDSHTGSVHWKYQDVTTKFSYPVIAADGTVIVGRRLPNSDPAHPQATLVALDGATGQKKWESQAMGALSAWPAIGDEGTIYFPTVDHRLIAVAGATGLKQWEFYSEGEWFESPPAIGPGGLVYLDGTSSLHAIRGNGRRGLAASPWPKFQANARNTGNLAEDIRVLDRIPSPVTVRTPAGSGVAGFADGTGTNSAFNAPGGCFVDAGGQVYVADTGNHRIRVVSSSGTVTTLAGMGVAGHRDGPAATAQFNGPLGICADARGNVFVTETNHFVRKIGADGQVSTLAGTGVPGYVDGPADSAQFNAPHGLAVDGAGNLWVTDFNNHAVRQISSDGRVITWVGNGSAGSADGPLNEARLNQPTGIAFDRTGNLYVNEWGGQRLRRIGADGQVSTVAGDGTPGYVDDLGLMARFNHPDGLVVDGDGNVLLADTWNHAIRRFTPAGLVQTVAGRSVSGFADGDVANALFRLPGGIGGDGQNRLYVADTGNNRVRRIEYISTVPVLAAILDQTIDEMKTLTLAVSATDPDPESLPLRFSLQTGAPEGLPSGIWIDGSTGILTWTPTEAQGPGIYRVKVVVTDRYGTQGASTVVVVVNEVSQPPMLAPILDDMVDFGQTYTLSLNATDADLPPQYLTYSLEPNAPPGMSIQMFPWLLTWPPSATRTPGAYPVSVRVTDTYGASDVQRFTVVVGAIAHQKWIFQTQGPVTGCPAIGEDGTVYVGSGDGKLYALEGASGSNRWAFNTDASVASAPLLGAGGSVFVGSISHRIFFLDAATGARKWRSEPEICIFSAFGLGGDGTLYAASGGNINTAINLVRALDDFTGETKWEFSLDLRGSPGGSSAPAVGADGTVYIGTVDHRLYALVGATGATKWSFLAEAMVNSAPAIGADGTVYFGAEDGRFYAVEGATGKKQWEFAAAAAIEGSAALGANGAIYFGSLDHHLYALDLQTGDRKWAVETRSPVSTTPAIAADGTVYATSSDGILYALDEVTGDKKWVFRMGNGPGSSPAVGRDGTVYVGGGDGNVYALNGEDHGGLAASPWPKFQRDARNTGYAGMIAGNQPPHLQVPSNQYLDELSTLRVTLIAMDPDILTNTLTFGLVAPPDGMVLDPATGILTWTPTEAQGPSTNRITVSVTDNGLPPLSATQSFTVVVNEVNSAPVMQDIASLPIYITNSLTLQLSATDADWPPQPLTFTLDRGAPAGMTLDSKTGILLWNPNSSQRPSTNLVTVQVTDSLGTCDRKSFTVVVGLLSGEEVWSFRAPLGIGSSVAIGDDGTIYFGGIIHDDFRALDGATGTKKWTFYGNGYSSTPALGDDGTVYVVSEDHHVYALDGASGRKKWQSEVGDQTFGSPVIGPEGTVYVPLDKLYALDGATGEKKWTVQISGWSDSLAVGANGTVFIGGGDRLYALDGATGHTNWTFPFPPAYCTVALGNSDTLFAASDQVYALDSNTGSVKWKYRADATRFSYPTVSADGAVIVGTYDVKPNGLGTVLALNSVSGQKQWETPIFATVSSWPAIGDAGTIYLTTWDRLMALAGATGIKQWEFPVASYTLTLPPAIGPGGLVYFGESDRDNKLHAVMGNGDHGLANSPWPKFHGNARNTGRSRLPLLNHAPILVPPPDQSLDELTTLRVTNRATDVEAPAGNLSFSLLSAPTGVAVQSATGVLTWTPTEAQGPSTNRITVCVTEYGVSPLSATNSFMVVVNEVNNAPVLTTVIRNYTVTAGATLVFTNTATDSDIPTNSLTYVLDLGAPSGAVIDRHTGVFTWTASGSPATDQFKIWVTDDGVPYRSGFGEFTVVTLPKPRDLAFGGILREADGRIALTWAAKPGARYQLQYKNRLDEANWMGIGNPLTATSETLSLTEAIGTESQRFYRVMRLAD